MHESVKTSLKAVKVIAEDKNESGCLRNKTKKTNNYLFLENFEPKEIIG